MEYARDDRHLSRFGMIRKTMYVNKRMIRFSMYTPTDSRVIKFNKNIQKGDAIVNFILKSKFKGRNPIIKIIH